MTAQDFAYWLRGYTEIEGNKMPTEIQWKMICDHLELVFKKETVIGKFPSTSTNSALNLKDPTTSTTLYC